MDTAYPALRPRAQTSEGGLVRWLQHSAPASLRGPPAPRSAVPPAPGLCGCLARAESPRFHSAAACLVAGADARGSSGPGL